MSAFFMSELGLRITNHTVREGKWVDQDHDWPWLSTAMTIEPDPGALFGSTALAAMPLRMMQMFVGMTSEKTPFSFFESKNERKNRPEIR
jgi:hypothetical protein